MGLNNKNKITDIYMYYQFPPVSIPFFSMFFFFSNHVIQHAKSPIPTVPFDLDLKCAITGKKLTKVSMKSSIISSLITTCEGSVTSMSEIRSFSYLSIYYHVFKKVEIWPL